MSKITGSSTPLVRPTATQQTADTGKLDDNINSQVAGNQQVASPASPYSDKTKANLKAEFAITGDLIRASLKSKTPGTQELSAPPTLKNESKLSEQNPVPRTFNLELEEIDHKYDEMARSLETQFQKLVDEALKQVPPDYEAVAKLEEDRDKALAEIEKQKQKALAEAKNRQEEEAARRADIKEDISTYGLGNVANGLVDYQKKKNERPPK